MTHKLVIVKKRDPERDPRVTFFLLFFPSLRLCSTWRILKSDWVNLTFAALSLIFIRGHEGFSKYHADRVVIGLPCGQGQLSRIWKVQHERLSVGKECCPQLSRHLWGGMKHELPKKRLCGRLLFTQHRNNIVLYNNSAVTNDLIGWAYTISGQGIEQLGSSLVLFFLCF